MHSRNLQNVVFNVLQVSVFSSPYNVNIATSDFYMPSSFINYLKSLNLIFKTIINLSLYIFFLFQPILSLSIISHTNFFPSPCNFQVFFLWRYFIYVIWSCQYTKLKNIIEWRDRWVIIFLYSWTTRYQSNLSRTFPSIFFWIYNARTESSIEAPLQQYTEIKQRGRLWTCLVAQILKGLECHIQKLMKLYKFTLINL